MSELLVRYVVRGGGEPYEWSTRPATPSEIAAAHPKCGTCGHWQDSGMYDVGSDERIGSCSKLPGLQAYEGFYCPHHTELTGESDEL